MMGTLPGMDGTKTAYDGGFMGLGRPGDFRSDHRGDPEARVDQDLIRRLEENNLIGDQVIVQQLANGLGFNKMK